MPSVLRSVLATPGGVVRSRAALHLEVLALRHQLQVVQRSQPRRLVPWALGGHPRLYDTGDLTRAPTNVITAKGYVGHFR